MIVSIHQPCYLPWLGHFDRVQKSDLHIVLDNVRINHGTKTQFSNRNKIRTREGWMWLSIPILTKGEPEDLVINRVRVAPISWTRKHWENIKANYAKAPHFAAHQDFLKEIYQREWPLLSEVCMVTNDYICDQLQIKTPVVFSSKLNVTGTKDELVRNLCREVGADQYLSGPFGRDYLDISAFEESGINVVFHDYQHPEYPQVGEGFEPYMCALDLLLNCGPQSREILGSGNFK